MLGIRTRSRRTAGADKTTELWHLKLCLSIFFFPGNGVSSWWVGLGQGRAGVGPRVGGSFNQNSEKDFSAASSLFLIIRSIKDHLIRPSSAKDEKIFLLIIKQYFLFFQVRILCFFLFSNSSKPMFMIQTIDLKLDKQIGGTIYRPILAANKA